MIARIKFDVDEKSLASSSRHKSSGADTRGLLLSHLPLTSCPSFRYDTTLSVAGDESSENVWALLALSKTSWNTSSNQANRRPVGLQIVSLGGSEAGWVLLSLL